jgi:hypothetical protein
VSRVLRRIIRSRSSRYTRVEVPDGGALGRVAEIVEIPEPMVEGYLVVAFLATGDLGVAHNLCCMPHAMSMAAQKMVGSSDLMAPRTADHESRTK